MASAYSDDLRLRVIEYVDSGKSKAEASRLFRLGYRTVERWMKRYRTTGKVAAEQVGRPVGTGKIDSAALIASVAVDSDKKLEGRGREFGVSAAAMSKAMQRCKLSHKKNAAVRGAG